MSFHLKNSHEEHAAGLPLLLTNALLATVQTNQKPQINNNCCYDTKDVGTSAILSHYWAPRILDKQNSGD
jgi:hypothetical protein